MRDRQFKKGDWVYWFYPRRYKGRSPKWARQYIGPFLITRVIPPCNYVIQKSARSKPIVTHTDKLKACLGEVPKSWLTDVGDSPSTDEAVPLPGEDEEDVSGDESWAGNHEPSAHGEPDQVTEAPTSTMTPVEWGDTDVQEPAGLSRPPSPPSEPVDPTASPSRQLRNRGQLRRPARYKD